MITLTGDTTVLTNENYEVLIAILERLRCEVGLYKFVT